MAVITTSNPPTVSPRTDTHMGFLRKAQGADW